MECGDTEGEGTQQDRKKERETLIHREAARESRRDWSSPRRGEVSQVQPSSHGPPSALAPLTQSRAC